jgi:hypothetical protein
MAFPTPEADTTAEPGQTTLILAYLDSVVALINQHFADASQHVPPTTIQQSNQTGTAYTLVLSDAGKVVEMNNASPNTLTVPPFSSVAFPIGTMLEVYQQSSGTTTIAAGAGVTVRNAGALRAQYSTAALRKRDTNTWVVSGDMA